MSRAVSIVAKADHPADPTNLGASITPEPDLERAGWAATDEMNASRGVRWATTIGRVVCESGHTTKGLVGAFVVLAAVTLLAIMAAVWLRRCAQRRHTLSPPGWRRDGADWVAASPSSPNT
jgi:hypothetical protein